MRRWFSTWYTIETARGRGRVPVLKAPSFLGHASVRGMRNSNEDRYFAGMLDLPALGSDSGSSRYSVLNAAVFDGHGGSQCSQFLSENLATYVETQDLSEGPTLAREFGQRYGGYWRAWQSTLGKWIRDLDKSQYDDFALRLPLAFLRADLDECTRDPYAGSTCTSAYIYSLDPTRPYWEIGSPANITVAQIGDSRAIISDNLGNVRPLSTVHHAGSPLETDRLRMFEHRFQTLPGGEQLFMEYVNTRAFGDVRAKPQGMSAEPDLVSYQLGVGKLPTPEAFLLLVTDGVTDVVSDQELADLVIQSAVKAGSLRGTPQDAAAEVVSFAETLGSRDNCTALVIRLGGWGNWHGWKDRSGRKRESRLKAGPLRRQ